ncbi:MAG: DNA helicase II [Firmicutes bacterium]|nr:DNA helicase II [Bacillota bacterium]
MLSEAQQRAAQTIGHLLIPACPGSGKTTVLKHRAEFLLRSDPRGKIVAVTFTNEAASSLEGRIKEQYPEGVKRVTAGTFHGLCKRQCIAAGHKVNLLNDLQCSRILMDAIISSPAAEAGIGFESAKQALDEWKRDPDLILPHPEKDPRVYAFRRYEEIKSQHGGWDFSDLLLRAVQGIRSGQIPPLDVRWMLVDEFQDTDKIQLAWVMEHVKAGVDVTIVGDDDQSIYGWRGALGYAGMMDFKNLTNATQVNLDRTYRCSLEVLKPAARLIMHNSARVEKDLATASTEIGVVSVVSCLDRESEVKRCIEIVRDTGKPEQWAILARTNSLLEDVEIQIGDAFHYYRPGGTSFWELKAPALLYDTLMSFARGDLMGIDAMLRACNVSRGFLDEIALTFDSESKNSLDRFVAGRLPGKAGKDDKNFMALTQGFCRDWLWMFRSGDAKQMALAANGIGFFIAKNAELSKKAESKSEDARRLSAAAAQVGRMKGSLLERLLALRRNKKDGNKGVALLSLHASKGLEFDKVWMIGCNQGILPLKECDVEEERRLTYVGMTRAKTLLYLSYHMEEEPSQFLMQSGLFRTGLFNPG